MKCRFFGVLYIQTGKYYTVDHSIYLIHYSLIPDDVGCFTVSRKISPLKKFPESPESVGTTFLLFTHKNGTITNHATTLNTDDAQIIFSGEGQQSILDSDFDLQLPVKIIIHGFKGSGKDRGALLGVDAFLRMVRN
jgi:hypothetical protein